MVYRRKDSGIYRATFTGPNGQRIRRSTGTTDLCKAEALESKWKLEVYRERQWEEKPEHTLDELMLEYPRANAENAVPGVTLGSSDICANSSVQSLYEN